MRASAAAPAAALDREDIGNLTVGAAGDAALLQLVEGDFEFRDVLGETRRGRQQLLCAASSSAAASGRRPKP